MNTVSNEGCENQTAHAPSFWSRFRLPKDRKINPAREQIVAHMNGNICRCGTYQRIVKAIQRAAKEA